MKVSDGLCLIFVFCLRSLTKAFSVSTTFLNQQTNQREMLLIFQ